MYIQVYLNHVSNNGIRGASILRPELSYCSLHSRLVQKMRLSAYNFVHLFSRAFPLPSRTETSLGRPVISGYSMPPSEPLPRSASALST